MAITQVSRIQHRRGLRIDLPNTLNDAEFGWAENTQELFIGNGPASPVGGNTQILTAVSSASIPEYSYISNTGTDAITGYERSPLDLFVPSANYPTIRSYQEKFDDYVSILDYDGVGDGTDNTAAIRRAMYDIYDEAASPVATLRKYRALYFPAGTYTITKEIYLYPFTRIFGDGKGRTKIILANGGTRTGTEDDCVARTVDSKGQIGAAIDGSAVLAPGNMHIYGITFESETSHGESYTLGQMDIIKMEDAIDARFEDCEFIGTWTTGSSVTSRAIHIDNPGSTSGPMGNYSFLDCKFNGTAYGFNPVTATRNVYVADSYLNMHRFGVVMGDGDTLAVSQFHVSHSKFSNINEVGFDVDTTSFGNISSYNHYAGNGGSDYTVAAVRFAGIGDFVSGGDTTANSVSFGDTFDITTPYACADKLTNTRVQNRSEENIVMNAQDLVQLSQGFCGTITLSELSISDKITSARTPVTVVDENTVVMSLSFTASTTQAIFADYVMEQTSETVYRVGSLRIVHDGVAAITYNETYAELGGPPSDPIALEAVINGSNIELSVIGAAGAALTPIYNFLPRVIDL